MVIHEPGIEGAKSLNFSLGDIWFLLSSLCYVLSMSLGRFKIVKLD